MKTAGAMVGGVALAVAAWLVFVACGAPPLPPECGYTVTVTTRDAGR